MCKAASGLRPPAVWTALAYCLRSNALILFPTGPGFSRKQRLKSYLLILCSLLAVDLLPSTASAQTSCHLLTSSNTVPAGFGAAYNLFSSDREVILKVNCGPGSTSTFIVGNGQNSLYIYKTGYEWTGSSWREIALSGQQRVGDWYVGSAAANLTRSEGQLAEDNFVLAYTCFGNGSRWECGCKDSECATAYWQLQAFKTPASNVGPGGGDTGGDETDSIPAPTRAIKVSNSSQLSSALSSAEPGDHIVLANGTYSGFTVARNGQVGKPIVVRAANTLGAKVNGNISLTGAYAWAVGFEVRGTVNLSGNGNRISRSVIRATGYSVKTRESARNAIIDHNEIISLSTGKEVGWYGIGMLVQDGTSHHHRVYRNYLRDAPALTTGDDNTAIGCGVNSFRWATKTENVIEYNLIENWRGDAEVLMAKSSACTFRFNTIVNSLEMNSRTGDGNKFIANWCENSQGIRIHGRDHEVIGNKCNVRIMPGNCAPGEDAVDDSCNYTPATRTLVASNTGSLRLGIGFSGHDQYPIRDTRVEGHNGPISRGKETGTTISSVTTRTISQAVKLTPSEVGPLAPTAPRIDSDTALF